MAEKLQVTARPPVCDRIGNEISPGTLLYWHRADVIVHCMEVVPPTPPAKGKPPVAGRIAIMVQMQINASGPLSDFMVLVNPHEQARAEQAIAEMDGKPLAVAEDPVDLSRLRELASASVPGQGELDGSKAEDHAE